MISPRDTIVANDSILDAFQQSRNYDYARELVPGHDDVNYFDRFWRYLEDLFDFDASPWDIPEWCWWFLGTLVVLAIGFFIWKHQAGFFSRKDVDLKAEDITEDDINEVDFDQLIAAAEKNGDHLLLCRLRYLKALKMASDAALVTWRRYKTPSQYAMEWQDEDFNFMTNHFLRIRYGHYTADAELAEEMRSRLEAVQARIASSIDKQEPANRQEEGGVPS